METNWLECPKEWLPCDLACRTNGETSSVAKSNPYENIETETKVQLKIYSCITNYQEKNMICYKKEQSALFPYASGGKRSQLAKLI